MDKPERELAERMGLIAEALIFGGPEAHERQAARRTEAFAETDTLPAKMSLAVSRWIQPDEEEENERLARETLAKWGVKFLGPVEGDPSLQRVELPTGWKKVPTYEPRLVMLVDNKGRERARICLFSGSKSLIIQPRYGIKEEPDHFLYGTGPILAVVTDGRIVTGEPGDGVLFKTEPTKPISGEGRAGRLERAGARFKASDQAKAWLDEHYPNWRDALTYWG